MPGKFQVKSKWSIGHIVFGLIAFIAIIGGAVAFSSRQLAMNTDNRSQAAGMKATTATTATATNTSCNGIPQPDCTAPCSWATQTSTRSCTQAECDANQGSCRNQETSPGSCNPRPGRTDCSVFNVSNCVNCRGRNWLACPSSECVATAPQSSCTGSVTVTTGRCEGNQNAPICASHTYGNWSQCIDGVRNRSLTSSSPAGCQGGAQIVTSESCGGTPPNSGTNPPPNSGTTNPPPANPGTPSQPAGCGGGCGSSADCASGLSCFNSVCWNANSCGGGTPTNPVNPPPVPPVAPPPIPVTYERCKLHQTWWRRGNSLENYLTEVKGYYRTINYDSVGNLQYSTATNPQEFGLPALGAATGDQILTFTSDVVVKQGDTRVLRQFVGRGSKIYSRSVPVNSDGSLQFGAASPFVEVTAEFSEIGANASQTFSTLPVSNGTQIQYAAWQSNKGWLGNGSWDNNAQKWSANLSQIASNTNGLPGGASAVLQATDEFINPQGTKVTQIVYQGNKGYMRSVPVTGGAPVYASAESWSVAVDLNSNPTALAGRGDVLAVSNYVICPQ